MPGFIQNVADTSYGYVDPFVQKTRNAVPLFDKAAHIVEERVPPLITKVDQFAEPTIEKIRPKVEPYVKLGVEEAEKVKKIAMPYYEGGAKKVEEAKELVIALEKEGVKQVKDIQCDVQQLVKHPKDIQQIYRVPASADLQELKSVSKISLLLDKVETLIDKYLPPAPNNIDTQSDDSNASEKSAILPRVLTIPSTLIHRLAFNAMRLIPKKEDLTFANLKAHVLKAKKYIVTTLTTVCVSTQKKLHAKIALGWSKTKSFVEKNSEALNKTRFGKFLFATAFSTAKKANVVGEKILGKERMQTYLTKVQGFISCPCDAAPPATTQKPAEQKKKKKDESKKPGA